MPEPMLMRRRVMSVALESTKGTAVAVTAAAAGTIVYDPVMEPDDLFSDGEREPAQGSAGTRESVVGIRTGTCTFRTEAVHDDQWKTLIAGCGFVVASSSTETATPTLVLSSQKTLTLGLFEDGRKKILYGCSGTATLTCAGAGQRFFWDWDFKGIWSAVADVALPSDVLTLSKGYRNQAITFNLGGAAAGPVDAITVALNSTVQPREDTKLATGVAYFFVEQMKPTVSVGVESALVATSDEYGKFLAGTAEAFSMVLAEPASKTFTLTGVKAQRISVGSGERNGKSVDELEIGLHVSAGNDALVMVQSA